jgi:hypothetical protein
MTLMGLLFANKVYLKQRFKWEKLNNPI